MRYVGDNHRKPMGLPVLIHTSVSVDLAQTIVRELVKDQMREEYQAYFVKLVPTLLARQQGNLRELCLHSMMHMKREEARNKTLSLATKTLSLATKTLSLGRVGLSGPERALSMSNFSIIFNHKLMTLRGTIATIAGARCRGR